ncbi:unnamed protein product [Trichobilharzia regenti]|nr:unnamed protein product [Trichobilharzia regenti]
MVNDMVDQYQDNMKYALHRNQMMQLHGLLQKVSILIQVILLIMLQLVQQVMMNCKLCMFICVYRKYILLTLTPCLTYLYIILRFSYN